MKRILPACLAACLALAVPASAAQPCDLFGSPGLDVVVRYPIPDTDIPDTHDNRHVLFKVAPLQATQMHTLGEADPRIVAIADFDPEGAGCEVLWEEREPGPAHQEEGAIKVALTDGFVQASTAIFFQGNHRPARPWTIAGALDLTGDGRADVLWWNPVTGGMTLWARAADGWRVSQVIGQLMPMASLPAGSLDDLPQTAIVRFEQGGRPGILWRDPLNDGTAARYYRTRLDQGTLVVEAAGFVQGLGMGGFSLAAVGDVDGDLKDDVLLRRASDSRILVCLMDGFVLRQPCGSLPPGTFAGDPGEEWFVAGPR